ncbi:MAG: FAD-dependent oxidoreductase [Candidatus Riflebacteria bacterium]|nr:FAD-dependent oxidoreductase [Candidatus Riflebacteria bacterium]
MKNNDGYLKMDDGFSYDQALMEAERCLLCHEPPCSKGCPAKTDPGTFIRKFRMRNVTGAIRTIKENNILGGACGVLCPTCRLCEKECSATGIDKPIRIGKIQRFLIEHSWQVGFKTFDNPMSTDPGRQAEKIAIIGAGPAGLSCAAELAKSGYSVTIFEEREEAGGVLRYGVPSFRFSRSFLKNDLRDLEDLGVKIKCSSAIQKKGDVEKLLEQGFNAVFIGVGLWAPISLKKVPEDDSNIFSSVRFLETFRQEKFKELEKVCRGKIVAVIGGGSVAMDCARVALKLGAKDVNLIYRRSYSQMPAEPDEKIEALEEGIHFILLNQPTDYCRDSKGKLKGINLIRTRLAGADSKSGGSAAARGSGRRKPVEIPGSEWVMECDTAIEAIGNKAAADSGDWYPSVSVNSEMLVQADKETGQTNMEGIFAGGDIVRGPGTVVQAVADGKTAAKSIIGWLEKKRLKPAGYVSSRKEKKV